MRTGHHTHLSEGRIDYKELRKINPEAARTAVSEYLKTNPNISQTARMFSITRCEENAHLERSHRTDDEEFYIPRVLRIKSEADLLNEAMGYIYYYDNVRGHSSLSYQAPFAYLKWQLPDLDDKIRFVIPIMLDKVSVELGTWSGYHVLALR